MGRVCSFPGLFGKRRRLGWKQGNLLLFLGLNTVHPVEFFGKTNKKNGMPGRLGACRSGELVSISNIDAERA